jgi:hypothetical protein
MIATTGTVRARSTALVDGVRRHAGVPSVRIGLLLATLVAALAWNARSHGAPSDDGMLGAPPLPVPAARCGMAPDDDAELSTHVRRLVATARASVDRYPFRPAEGLAALDLLEEAVACAALTAAGAGVDLDALHAHARAFRRRVELDYRDRVLRVERALSLDQTQGVRADVEVLAAQLEGEDHPFALRMRNLRSRLADGRLE